MKLNDYAQSVNRKLKKNVVAKADEVVVVPRADSGSFALNVELGGGTPEGRIITLAGLDGDGKSALSLMMASGILEKYKNHKCLWVDAEGVFDDEWSALLGLDIDRTRVVHPDYAEQGYQIAIDALQVVSDLGVLVIDSVAAMTPKAEAEGEMEDVQVALQARLHKKFLRKAQRLLLDSNRAVVPTIILINQMTTDIGSYGNPEKEGGGRGLRYYPSVKIILKKGDLFDGKKVYKYIGVNDEGIEPKAQVIKFYIEKNKTAPGKRRGHFWFYFDHLDSKRPKGSVDRLEEIIRYAFKYDIIRRASEKSRFYFLPNPTTGEEIKIEGRENVAEYIRHNEAIRTWIQEQVMARVNKKYEDEPIQEEKTEEPEGTVTDEVPFLDGWDSLGDDFTEGEESSEGNRSETTA